MTCNYLFICYQSRNNLYKYFIIAHVYYVFMKAFYEYEILILLSFVKKIVFFILHRNILYMIQNPGGNSDSD